MRVPIYRKDGEWWIRGWLVYYGTLLLLVAGLAVFFYVRRP